MNVAASQQQTRRRYRKTGEYTIRALLKDAKGKPISGRTKQGRLYRALLKDVSDKPTVQQRILARQLLRAVELRDTLDVQGIGLKDVNRRYNRLTEYAAGKIKLDDIILRTVALLGAERGKSRQPDLARRIMEDLRTRGSVRDAAEREREGAETER